MRHLPKLRNVGFTLLTVTLSIFIQHLNAQEINPYSATVKVNQAALRSGPGEDFYAVDLLERGADVEVHKNIEGWCAIRPPEGCFSWVPARQLRLDATGKVAEVIDAKAYSFIGSNLARPTVHMYQIKLSVGERVAILGEQRFARNKEQITETWYKIQPPAGEFRWIEARFLSKPPTTPQTMIVAGTEPSALEEKVAHQEPIREPEPLPTKSTRSPAPIQSHTRSAPSELAQSTPAQTVPASLPPAQPASNSSSPKRGGFRDVTPGREQPALKEFSQSSRSKPTEQIPNKQVTFTEPFETNESQRSRDASPNTPSQSNFPEPTGDFYADLQSLENDVSLAISNRNPSEVNFTALASRAQKLADSGSSPVDRGRARMIMERISQFESHQKQMLDLQMRQAVSNTKSRVDQPQEPAAGAPWKPADSEPQPTDAAGSSPPPEQPKSPNWIEKVTDVVGIGLKGAAPSPTGAATPTHFDAQGKLQEVRVKDESVKYPPYALLDDEGSIVAFVGSPVVKLDKYVGKRVGVYGRRGLHAASKTTYFEVVELVDLEVTQRTSNKPLRTTFGAMK